MVKIWIKHTLALVVAQFVLIVVLITATQFVPNNIVIKTFAVPYEVVTAWLWNTSLSHGKHAWQYTMFAFVIPFCTMTVYAMFLSLLWSLIANLTKGRTVKKTKEK